MNDIQLYNLYLHIPLWNIGSPTRIYPKYVVHMGRSFFGPNPHRHYSFEEFVDKLNEDSDFRTVILN